MNSLTGIISGKNALERMNMQSGKYWPRKHWLSLAAVILLIGTGIVPGIKTGAAAQTELVVFAAASTTHALTEIGELYASRNPVRITPSFASASTLARQIESGAPADVYLSANREWMDFLEEKNLIVKKSRFDLLGNRLVLIVPADSPVKQIDVMPGFSLSGVLGKDGRMSTGDPDHVPVGMYGKKALQNLGVWDQVKDRLAPMNDVRSALVMVERGEAPLGLVYATDAAVSKKVRIAGMFPAGCHPPIVYPVAAVSAGKVNEARKFIDFLKSPEAGAIFKKYAFDVR
jgi:molybdate transport system substrate-binding protein